MLLLTDPSMMPIVVAIGAALIVLVIGIGLSGGGDASKRDIDKRLRHSGEQDSKYKATASRSVRRDEPKSGFNALMRRILPNPEKIRIVLERTGKRISIGEFFLICVGTAFVMALILKLTTPLPAAVAASAGILISLLIPYKVIKIMGNRRNNKFMKDFSAAIDMIVRGIKSGLPFSEAVNSVGHEFADPVGIEFRRITDSVKLGQSMEGAMWEVARRVDAPEFKFMIVAMTIQRETGGNLAETLGNLAELLRKRRALKLKIKALSSEARASAYIIGALPFIMGFMLKVANPEYIQLLFDTDRGNRMLMYAGGFLFTGYYAMYKMVNFEV